MTKVQVTLPEALKQFIDGLVAEGAFKDPSEYLQTLIDRDRQARHKARIEALLIEGLDSGPRGGKRRFAFTRPDRLPGRLPRRHLRLRLLRLRLRR